MTGNIQNGPAPHGGMPGPASNTQMPQQQPYPRVAQQAQPNQPYPMQPGQQSESRSQQSAQYPNQGAFQRRESQLGGMPPVDGGSGRSDGSAPKGPDNRKRNIGIIVGVVVAVIIIVICAFIFIGNASNNAFYDPSAQEGQASYKTLEEIEAERNRQMQEGMLNISIASQIEFENGTSPGTAYIENVPSNKYVLKVTITTDSDGEVVYQSGGIKPDSYIETITLSEPLAAGVYPATATFSAYDPDTLEEVGQAAAKVTLVVKQ